MVIVIHGCLEHARVNCFLGLDVGSDVVIALPRHLTAFRAWCKQGMSAWSVKTGRFLSGHFRDARVCGHA